MRETTTWVTPPELDPLPWLFAPDAARAWLLGEIWERVAAAQNREIDAARSGSTKSESAAVKATMILGEEAGTAPEMVELLIGRGVRNVTVMALAWQKPLVDVLSARFADAGISFDEEIVTAPADLPLAVPQRGVRGVPLFDAERDPDLVAELAIERGLQSVRLLRRRSSLGLSREEHRALHALFHRHAPHHLPYLTSISLQESHCIEPSLEMWGGNGIAERNRDLLVNVVA